MLNRQLAQLFDCNRSSDVEHTELFIVEGASAAAAVDRLRDRRGQAVLAMQGKPLNAFKAGEEKVRRNRFLGGVIQALGSDIGLKCCLSSARYDRVFLLCDQDADGIHCATLLLLFFYRWQRPWLEAGKLFMVRPPLMQLVSSHLPSPSLAYSEEEGQAMIAALAARGLRDISKQRFRGLASLPPATLLATCIHPATRRSEAMTIRDAQDCLTLLGLSETG